VESGLQSALHPHSVRPLTEGDDTRGCGDTIGPPACCSRHVEERSVKYILLKSGGIVHWVGGLKGLYYDAQSEKNQINVKWLGYEPDSPGEDAYSDDWHTETLYSTTFVAKSCHRNNHISRKQ